MRFVNYDENLVVEAVTNEKGIAIGKQLIPGNYTVSVSGGVENEGTTYYLNGSVQNTALTQTVTDEEAESGCFGKRLFNCNKAGSHRTGLLQGDFLCGKPGLLLQKPVLRDIQQQR